MWTRNGVNPHPLLTLIIVFTIDRGKRISRGFISQMMREGQPAPLIGRGSVGNREGKRDLARKQLRSLFGRPIAGQLVGDHDAGRPHLLFQQLAQEPLGNLLVASALDQNVEHDAGLVYGSPQPMLHPGDLEYDLG